MIEKVVNALAREGFSNLAAPIIDRGTDAHPDNLPLLKVRWLVHLAENDWKGAIQAGDLMLARDQAAQSDPDFYTRLAMALRSDGKSERALAVAANAVAKFRNPRRSTFSIFSCSSEGDSGAPTRLGRVSDNAEVHVFAAQTFKGTGNEAAALPETKRALAVNPSFRTATAARASRSTPVRPTAPSRRSTWR
jgi:tetratricopeptide (TPR) repeat protein